MSAFSHIVLTSLGYPRDCRCNSTIVSIGKTSEAFALPAIFIRRYT